MSNVSCGCPLTEEQMDILFTDPFGSHIIDHNNDDARCQDCSWVGTSEAANQHMTDTFIETPQWWSDRLAQLGN